MSECKNVFSILNELMENAKEIQNEDVLKVEDLIMNAKRIFVGGAGRSGFAARGFSNRLMHLGFQVYFVGEPTTPSIQEGDLLIVGSGSGKYSQLSFQCQDCKGSGSKGCDCHNVPRK